MPADLTKGEAIVEGPIPVHVNGLLQHVFTTDGFWFAQVEFASNSGGYQRVCVPLRLVTMPPAAIP